MQKIDLSKIYTVSQMKQALKDAGSFYFSRNTMRFFNSKVHPGIIHKDEGNVFITSERFDNLTPRLYTVRILREDATVSTAGEFQEYTTLAQARKAAREL